MWVQSQICVFIVFFIWFIKTGPEFNFFCSWNKYFHAVFTFTNFYRNFNACYVLNLVGTFLWKQKLFWATKINIDICDSSAKYLSLALGIVFSFEEALSLNVNHLKIRIINKISIKLLDSNFAMLIIILEIVFSAYECFADINIFIILF